MITINNREIICGVFRVVPIKSSTIHEILKPC